MAADGIDVVVADSFLPVFVGADGVEDFRSWSGHHAQRGILVVVIAEEFVFSVIAHQAIVGRCVGTGISPSCAERPFHLCRSQAVEEGFALLVFRVQGEREGLRSGHAVFQVQVEEGLFVSACRIVVGHAAVCFIVSQRDDFVLVAFLLGQLIVEDIPIPVFVFAFLIPFQHNLVKSLVVVIGHLVVLLMIDERGRLFAFKGLIAAEDNQAHAVHIALVIAHEVLLHTGRKVAHEGSSAPHGEGDGHGDSFLRRSRPGGRRFGEVVLAGGQGQ